MDSGSQIYEKVRPSVVREVEGERVLLEMNDSGREIEQVHLINEVGARILELIDGTRTILDLSREIRKEFDEVPESLDAEVQEFILKLCDLGQIRVRAEMEEG